MVKNASQYQNVVIFLQTVLMAVMNRRIVLKWHVKPNILLVRKVKNVYHKSK